MLKLGLWNLKLNIWVKYKTLLAVGFKKLAFPLLLIGLNSVKQVNFKTLNVEGRTLELETYHLGLIKDFPNKRFKIEHIYGNLDQQASVLQHIMIGSRKRKILIDLDKSITT